MNYYEKRQLQEQEGRMIGAGITFILMSPAFGIVAGIFLSSAAALYIATAVVAALGVLGIAAGIKEKVERNQQS